MQIRGVGKSYYRCVPQALSGPYDQPNIVDHTNFLDLGLSMCWEQLLWPAFFSIACAGSVLYANIFKI